MDKESLKKRMDHTDPANRLFLACPCLLISSIVLFLFSYLLTPSPNTSVAIEEAQTNNPDVFNKIAMAARIMPSNKETEDRSQMMVFEQGTSEYESFY